MQRLIFDHYTIKVADLDASTEFYKRVLGLEEITNRTRKSYIRWISMGDGRELHIVEGDTHKISTDVGVHLALRLRDFDSRSEERRVGTECRARLGQGQENERQRREESGSIQK